MFLIPVTGLARPASYQTAVASLAKIDGYGLCFRIGAGDTQQPAFVFELEQLRTTLQLDYSQIDLVIDFNVLINEPSDLSTIFDNIPQLDRWRTVTFIGGSFPRNLSKLEKNQEHTLERLEWKAWKKYIMTLPYDVRAPNFGDYTIQYALLPEPLAGPPNISASIRYATPDAWVIMRGEGLRNEDSPGPIQYSANALMLSFRSEFAGEDCCEGCRYIAERAKQLEDTGDVNEKENATTWLQAGLTHHLTVTADEVSTLLDFAVVGVP